MLRLLLSGVITLLLALVIRHLLTRGRKKGTYSQPGFWFVFWPRWIRYSIILWFKQYYRPKRLNNYNPQGFSYSTSGIVPTPSEVELENPKTLITARHDDGMFIWGGDKDGRCIVAKVVRLSKRRACVVLFVRDEEGNIYTLPNHPDSNIVNADNEHNWQGNGLLLECVEPMRTWRVKFNGFLRKGSRSQYVTDDSQDDDDKDFDIEDKNQRQIVEVRLDFLWKAMRAPVDIWRDNSNRLLAYALAREIGADSSAFKSLQRDGYDQSGALHGYIQINDEGESHWYLRGVRQHRWGMSDSETNLYRSVNLFSYFNGGDITWIEAFSFKTLISHCVLGYMQTSAGDYLPITSTSLELSEVGEDGEIPKNVFIEFTAGGKKVNLWHNLHDGILVHTGDPWTLQHDLKPTHAASSRQGDGWGLAIMSKRFTGLCPVPEHINLEVPQTIGDPGDSALVVPFSDVNCPLTRLTGGKGSSLACLASIAHKVQGNNLKFTVPNGLVVTSNAWRLQLKDSPELSSAIKFLEKAVASSQTIRMQEACSRIQLLMKTLKVNKAISNCLQDQIYKLFPAKDIQGKRFAVRSSGCSEDSSEASAAGQNESFLGCFWSDQKNLATLNEGQVTEKYSKNVLEALTACWGSQFAFQSMEYRRQRGKPLNDGMAVVIQEMVAANSAGVIFTLDPVTGSPASITISANYGLGESVVSASTDPDIIRVRRTWRNKLRIKDRTIGEKKIKHVMIDDGGTKEISVPSMDQQRMCLSDEQAYKLARIAIHVEESFGSPRDIEFALKENDIYLLQARPITSLNMWTDYELIHESDTAYISDSEYLTKANTGEVFPGYICPLTSSSIVKNLDLGLQSDFRQREWPRYKFDPSNLRNIALYCANCFLNIGEVALRGTESKISMVNHAVDLSIFGRLCTTPEIHKWALNRYGIMSWFANFVRTGYAFYDVLVNSKRVARIQALSNCEIETNRVQSSLPLYKEICRRIPDMAKIMETHSHTSAASTMTQCIALVTMANDKLDIKSEMIQDMASLLSCIGGDSESADVPKSLKTIAKAISSNEEMEDFLMMSPDEGRVWLESHPDAVGVTFRAFIAKHGHRCIKEFDLRALSWGIAPESLVSTLQTMVKNPSSYEKTKDIQILDEVLNSMKNELTTNKKRALKFIVKLCGKSVNLRETTKSLVIKSVDTFRKAYRTLGLIMVSECRLPDPDLIFFLHHREIGVLLETRSASLVAKAARRKRLMKQMEICRYEEIYFGVPQSINLEDKTLINAANNSEGKLLGTPVCHGQATGLARVITQLEDANSIQNGDILVTYCTDIGWTPYFPLLSGVVTEIGGLISHGAVVAREYGLPCVVGVKGASSTFSTGDLIFLDGKEGYIKKIK